MKTQIPIYRAKRLSRDEEVEGCLMHLSPNAPFYIITDFEGYENGKGKTNESCQIDPSTLAIHFPDMIDSEGTKIFASLSEDGMGGDELEWESEHMRMVAKYCEEDGAFFLVGLGAGLMTKQYCLNFKVTGIQE